MQSYQSPCRQLYASQEPRASSAKTLIRLLRLRNLIWVFPGCTGHFVGLLRVSCALAHLQMNLYHGLVFSLWCCWWNIWINLSCEKTAKSYQEGGASGPHSVTLRLLQGHHLESVQCIYTAHFTKSVDAVKFDSCSRHLLFQCYKKKKKEKERKLLIK